jgi:hypothetical protein
MQIEQAIERFNAVTDFVKTIMHEGVDYGTIPGTNKATLLKPGAEKLCTLFGLSCRFQLVKEVEDWTGDDHRGEPFFYFVYRCQLWHGDLLVAEADGSCNSWEKKYRWRSADRVCPNCERPTIIKGKAEYGGGWLCFAKKGGCGAKFRDGDASIEGQPTGQVPNPDIADAVNTIQKMAAKRALVAATLIAVNASEFFTQDLEDLEIIDARVLPAPVVEVEPTPEPDPIDEFWKKAGDFTGLTVDEVKQQLRKLGRTGVPIDSAEREMLLHILVDSLAEES